MTLLLTDLEGSTHTAEAVIADDGGYASLPINRCSRLMTAAHGGQVVISGATESLVRDDRIDIIATRECCLHPRQRGPETVFTGPVASIDR